MARGIGEKQSVAFRQENVSAARSGSATRFGESSLTMTFAFASTISGL